MPTIDDVKTWQGREAYGPQGEKLGTIQDVYLDQDTGQPEWLTIKTGLFGGGLSFAPIAEARESGTAVALPYTKDQIKGAPTVEPDGQLSQREEAALYRHYGLEYSEAASDSGLPSRGRESVGRDTSGPTTDDAMTRSEEEVAVGTRNVETGRARLRKYVVTEQVQTAVPVQREEVRLEREPITDGNVDRAMAGPEISEEEHEVVLHEEEPVVEKRIVPKERVRLGRDTVVDEREVSEQVRKEQIEFEGDR